MIHIPDDAEVTPADVRMLIEHGLTVQMVVDEAIQLNRMIGVGLIALGDALQKYCYTHSGYVVKNNLSADHINHELQSMTKTELEQMIGRKVCKLSDRPFKSGSKVNTIASVVKHAHIQAWSFTFKEDDSVVEARQCRVVENEPAG